MIKIIAGKFRSRIIDTPVEGTEPTKNRVREAIFSSIAGSLNNACCLDLFSGSGALGIEALSRGTSICFFNDISIKTCEIIKSNLDKLCINNCEVSCLDYMNALYKYKDKIFDIVFLDPPYAMKDSYKEVLDFMVSNEMLSKNVIIVLEYCESIEFDDSKFAKRKDYSYGKTKVTICRGLI